MRGLCNWLQYLVVFFFLLLVVWAAVISVNSLVGSVRRTQLQVVLLQKGGKKKKKMEKSQWILLCVLAEPLLVGETNLLLPRPWKITVCIDFGWDGLDSKIRLGSPNRGASLCGQFNHLGCTSNNSLQENKREKKKGEKTKTTVNWGCKSAKLQSPIKLKWNVKSKFN